MGCKYVPEELKKAARKELGAASEADLKKSEDKVNNGGGGSGASGGLTSAQISALDGLFKIAAYTEDASTAYNAFKVAFGISGSGGGESGGGPQKISGGIFLKNILSL